MSDTTTVQNSPAIVAIICGKFNGALSGFQRVVYRDLCYAGFDKKLAHRIAIDYGSQLGVAMRNDDKIKTAVKKANDSGIAKLSGSFSDKLSMHNSMAIYRVVSVTADLYKKEKLLKSYEVDVSTLSDILQAYLTECSVWVATQVWDEVTK